MSAADERWTFDGAAASVWRSAPSLAGRRTAAVGAFECEDGAAGARALREAVRRLRGEGFGAVLGPMDGSTWASYRLVVAGDGRPPFFMEPHNPPHYAAAFEDAGFTVVGRYFSAERDAGLQAGDGPAPAGVRLRSLRMEAFEAELRALFDLSLAAFSRNAFYTPIGVAGFLDAYLPVAPLVDPELVLLAEDARGVLQGYLFAMPDVAEGPQPRSVILKTYASRLAGCGSALVNAFHRRAREKGYERIVHALIHEDNLSARHSERTGAHVFRRYALWGVVS